MRLFTAMRAFNSVASQKSFAAAARELGMSTSSVSRHIMELEDELGVRLLNRTTRRLSLTEQGRQYHERSMEILGDLDDLHSITLDSQAKPTGRLRITASQTLGESWIVPLLPKFYAQFPDIVIVFDITDRVVDLVEEGFDVGVRSGELKESSMIARKLMELNYIACASPGYCDAHGMPTDLKELSGHKCIQYSHPTREWETWWFDLDGKEHHVEVEGIVAVNNTWAVRDLMVGGMGIGYVPDFVVEQDIEAGRLVRILGTYDASTDPVHVVYPHKRYLAPKTRAFVDFLVANADAPMEVW